MYFKHFIEEPTGSTTRHKFICVDTNEAGETLTVELNFTDCSDVINKEYCLPRLWLKAGLTKELLVTYWNARTEVKDKNGEVRMDYNPTVIYNNGRPTANMKYKLEGTQENANKIINDIYTMFINMNSNNPAHTHKRVFNY